MDSILKNVRGEFVQCFEPHVEQTVLSAFAHGSESLRLGTTKTITFTVRSKQRGSLWLLICQPFYDREEQTPCCFVPCELTAAVLRGAACLLCLVFFRRALTKLVDTWITSRIFAEPITASIRAQMVDSPAPVVDGGQSASPHIPQRRPRRRRSGKVSFDLGSSQLLSFLHCAQERKTPSFGIR